MMGNADKALEVSRRWQGRSLYADTWACEKLWKVGEGLAEARNNGYGLHYEDSWEPWRNLAKLACWMAGNTTAYDEDMVERAYQSGEDAMLFLLERYLSPQLTQGKNKLQAAKPSRR